MVLFPRRGSAQSRNAVHCHWHSGRNRNASQPLFAFLYRSNPEISDESRGTQRSHSLCDDRFYVCLDVCIVHQRGHSDRPAATFHHTGNQDVAEIGDAYKLLSPLLGTTLAGILFAVALLSSGQNSTLTGTLAGQIVMEGFLNIRLRPWLRRLITRLIAIVPASSCILYGESGTAKLLILSQVILSLQLSFAVFPLVQFTSDRVEDDSS